MSGASVRKDQGGRLRGMINVPWLQGQHVRIPTRGESVDWCYGGNVSTPRKGSVSTSRIRGEV